MDRHQKLNDRAAQHGPGIQVEGDSLNIWELANRSVNLGPGKISPQEDANYVLMAHVFLSGLEYGLRKAKPAYDKGVADAWADVRRRLKR